MTMMKTNLATSVVVLALWVPCLRAADRLKQRKPLVPPTAQWDLNDYCVRKQIGAKTFYVGTLYGWHVSWYDLDDMKCPGLDKLLVPGYINVSLYNPGRENPPKEAKLLQMQLDRRLPFHSIEYHAFKEDPDDTVTEEAKRKVGELWYGDSHPEYAYRLDFILPAVRGENSTCWQGNSTGTRRRDRSTKTGSQTCGGRRTR